jgi:hypothetical protein
MKTNNFEKFLALAEELKMNLKKTTGKNTSGIGHANSLISAGKVINPSSWNAPSASEENAYIEKNGMAAFGKWHLGIDANADPKTKQHWHYIFTSDFKNVDRAGLIAIRQRAGQQKQTDVFEAAGKMIDNIDK